MTETVTGPWLVTGARGMLGRGVLAALAADGVPALAAGRDELDLTDRASVHGYVMTHRPAVVVNCAAWTAVDDAESREPEALAVNGTGAGLLAQACGAAGALLLHVSTDYVFGGDGRLPYAEDAPPEPRTAYGRTKLAGELAVRATLPDTGYVVRTAWLYGAGGKNFVATLLRLERERETLDVVNDQWGQPTWAADLAGHLVLLGRAALAGTAPAGVYHGTSGGRTTWCAFAQEIFRLAGADPARVRPTTSAASPTVAHRPAYSVLGHDRWRAAGIEPIRDWRTALAAALPSTTHVPA
ncbi:dTDP-4-dehydrorhamnose reductase [Streptomyces lunaelactis]|uniref:dTDP-4-dehydrorhamnose reductase n=1 Tax=Streptomyces lunaelactis TaxID=1535768 RepID=UPI002815A0BA|nr:dTDP-4-dehydrorhamnose reductase [Streptomyces lunaelactis]